MPEDPALDLSVVIPAWNEAARLPSTLDRVVTALEGRADRRWEILVVSDGSDDGTDEAVEQRGDDRLRLLRQDTRRGKGAAVRTGMLAARGRRVLFSDADLATPIEDLGVLETAMAEGADVAIGSRRLPDSEITRDQGHLRRAMGRFFPHLMRWASGLPYADTQCGFKLFTADAARRLFEAHVDDGFAFDVEVLSRAREEGLRVVEVPIHWESRSGSKVSSIRDPLRMLAALLRLGSRRDLPQVRDHQLRVAAGLGLGLVVVPLLLLLATTPGATFPPILSAGILLGAVYLVGREVEDVTTGLVAALVACTTLLYVVSVHPPAAALPSALAVHGVVAALLLCTQRRAWGWLLFFLLGSALVTGGLPAFGLSLVLVALLVRAWPGKKLFSALPGMGGTALFLLVVGIGLQRADAPSAMLLAVPCANGESLTAASWSLLPLAWTPWLLLLVHPGVWATRPRQAPWRLPFLLWGILPAVGAVLLGLRDVSCLLAGLGGPAVLLGAAITAGARTGRIRSIRLLMIVAALVTLAALLVVHVILDLA